jgi:hypothetical protein
MPGLPPSLPPDVAILIPSADRTKRVKDAKSEAQKEIEEYRKKKEDEFKKFESEVGISALLPNHPALRIKLTTVAI